MPQILPFNFGDEEVNLDELISATCAVSKGDQPIKIWWSLSETDPKEYRNLTTNDGVVITKTSQKVSVLTIEQVQARHTGNYSCFASNRAGTVQHSSYLAINGY